MPLQTFQPMAMTAANDAQNVYKSFCQ